MTVFIEGDGRLDGTGLWLITGDDRWTGLAVRTSSSLIFRIGAKFLWSGGLGVRCSNLTGLICFIGGGVAMLGCCCWYCWTIGLDANCCLVSSSDGIELRVLSWTYSCTQKSPFTCGLGAGLKLAIGLGGILISGRQPIGGGSNDCGDFLLFPFVCGADNCWLLFTGGPVGKTWKGMPMASDPIEGGGGGGGIDPGVTGACTAGELLPFVLFWASGETFGWLCTPGLFMFAEMPKMVQNHKLVWWIFVINFSWKKLISILSFKNFTKFLDNKIFLILKWNWTHV